MEYSNNQLIINICQLKGKNSKKIQRLNTEITKPKTKEEMEKNLPYMLKENASDIFGKISNGNVLIDLVRYSNSNSQIIEKSAEIVETPCDYRAIYSY